MSASDRSRLPDGVRHLYVHLPFCAHRCGYCDFVTVVGRPDQHVAYSEALLRELELEQSLLVEPLETVFVGGGTPTYTRSEALFDLLTRLPGADEFTVEANPEGVTREIAGLLARAGVNRISIGAQSFRSHLLATLERRATPDDVGRAVGHFRSAGIDNVSLDLLYGIPGQTRADLVSDLEAAIELGVDHLSCYELESKRGTRFCHAHDMELTRQREAMEGYFGLVVETLTQAGYRWYETSNFCRPGRGAKHNLAYWHGRDYLGLGIGAVSTCGGIRWRNTAKLTNYLRALGDDARPPRELEPLSNGTRHVERLMLGLRLDEPLPVAEVRDAIDESALRRLERLDLLVETDGNLQLTRRGRFLGGAVTAELMVELPGN